MRTLAKAATSSLVALCAALVLVVVAVAAIGTLGTRSAAGRGNAIAGEDLTTSVVTGQLARNMDAAYAAGEAAVQATDPAMRSRLLGSLYTSLLPAVDAQLFSLERAHAGDPPAEHAEIDLFIRDWTAVRDLLSPPDLTARPAAALAGRLTAAYQPASAHLDRLILRELDDARADHASASASAARATGLILGVAAGGIVIGVLFLRRGIRRIRRNLEPGQGPGGARGDPADRERRGRGAPAAPAPPRAHASGDHRRGAQPEQQRGPAGGGHAAAARLAAAGDVARRGAALMPGGAVRPDAQRERRAAAPALLLGVRLRARRLVVRSAHGRRRGDRFRPAQPPGPLFGGRGTADPRVGHPGGARPREPPQPGRRGDPRRDRRPDRAAQQARGHGRAEADVRAGHDDEGAARAAPARPRPLQAGQRPGRACGGGPGPGEPRRHVAQRAAGPGLRRPQWRGGVRGPAARHRGRRGPRDSRAHPGGDRRDLPARHRRAGHRL